MKPKKQKRYRQVVVPREAFPEHYKGLRTIKVGMTDYDFRGGESAFLLENIYVASSAMYLSGETRGDIRFYHLSPLGCHHGSFYSTECYCIRIKDNKVHSITKHLPYKGSCR